MEKNLFSEALFSGGEEDNSLVSPDLEFFILVGAVHVADQVDHAGAEKRHRN
jgi:hypothetical protein